MNQESPSAEGPASLNPRSAGCILTAVAVLAAVVAGWLGLRLLKASSGDMALAAARNGLATSGLGSEPRDLLEAQLLRVEDAHHAGDLSPAQVIAAVNGLLQTPCLPTLRLRRVMEVDLPASTLPEDARAELAGSLAVLWRRLEAGEITVGQLSGVLGLGPVEPGEEATRLSDPELEAVGARAREVLATGSGDQPREAGPLPDPVEDFRLHVEGILNGGP